MSLKQAVFRLEHVFHDNPSLLVLVACGALAALFIGLIFLPRHFRKMKRRWRGKKRGTQA